MFVSIFGLPPNIKYQDLKILIKQQCNLIDIIIDNIVNAPDGTRKVRIGLADDGEAMRLIKGLDGYHLQGNHVLKVVPVGKSQPNPTHQVFDSQQYTNQNDYRGSQRPPVEINRQPWGPGNQNTWAHGAPLAQTPQTNFGYQQGYGQQPPFHSQPQEASYGLARSIDQYAGKPAESRRNMEVRSHGIRSVEIVDSPAVNQPPAHGRFPPGQGYHDKPGSMKDALHRPIRWESAADQQRPGSYQGQPHAESHWTARKLSPGRPDPGRTVPGRPLSPRHRAMSPSRPGIHGRQSPARISGRPTSPRHRMSPGRPMSPKNRMSPERMGRMGRPGSPRQAGRMDSGMLGRHSPGRMLSGRPGSLKSYPDHGRQGIDGRPGVTGRHLSPGRQHGRPGSPPNRQPGGRVIPPGKGSPPGRHLIRSGSPNLRLSGRPDSPGMMASGRPSSPGIRPFGRPGSPGIRLSGRPGSPVMRSSGRPGSPIMRPSGRAGSPVMRPSGRPGSPGMRLSGRPGSPGIRLSGRQGSPGMRPSGRQGSPGMRPSGRQGSPGMRPSARQGSPGMRSSGRPGSPGMRPSGRPLSPGNRPSARPVSPGMRPPGRPVSPRKLATFATRPVSPGSRMIHDQRSGILRSGSPEMKPQRSGSPRKLGPFSGRPISHDGRPLSDQRPGMGRPESPGRFGSARPGSPPAKRVSPHSRIPGPSGRSGSPGQRRGGDRGDSPRWMSPLRYSPDRRHLDKHDQFDQKSKSNRPAYDSMASSKGMYSGGFLSNVSWQKDDKYIKIHDEMREGRIPPKAVETEKRVHSLERKSRSPVRRERSPLRDRFKRHSPSPRSPRRSWALEKRQSPDIRDAPPPPVWPGQKRNDDQLSRRNIPERMEKEEKGKRAPVWEMLSDNKEIDHRRESRLDNERRFEEKGDRRDVVDRNLRSDRFAQQNERPKTFVPKFSPREINDRRDVHLDDEKRFNERQERRDFQRRSAERENQHRDGLIRQRNASPQQIDEQTVRRNFDKELEDIYKRAVEFRKKTEELRRSGDRKREGYDEEHSTKTERSRFASPGRREYKRSPSPEHRPRSRERIEWKIEQKPKLPDHVRAKRDKALKEIVNRLLERQTICDYIEGDFEQRVREELKIEISKIIQTIFGYEDVSFIEIVIKYQAKFTLKDEELMLQAVIDSLPHPNLKRKVPETSEVAAKTARRLSPTTVRETVRPNLNDVSSPTWTANIAPPKLATVSSLSTPLPNPQIGMISPAGLRQFGITPIPTPPVMFLGDNQHALAMNQHLMASQIAMHISEQINLSQPSMVPAPYDPVVENNNINESKGHYNLYLCHEDFQPFTLKQADEIKQFLFSKIVEVTETTRGWAPDITIKGLNSLYRYELQTNDPRSRDWLLSLNFSDFDTFEVVIYTKEELWYERAAIWLPGHSKSSLDPLKKLKLQNKHMIDVSIGKWKLVKKVVNEKGTRLFVDMPPACARALEKYKMMLSYELQKVNVFLRASAVDKDAFDLCMREFSITDKTVPYKSAQDATFPVIHNDPTSVKITLRGSQMMSIEEARKIKEVIIYNIFRYHKANGNLRTDFVRYGFCQPNYLAIVPENNDSKKWLLSRNLGKLKNSKIVIVGADEDETKMFTMKIVVDSGFSNQAAKILERLKSSNKGVKGINFNMWKVYPLSRVIDDRLVSIEVKVDLESLETLKSMKYQLDYVTDKNKTEVVTIKSTMSLNRLEEELKKYKAEMLDSYDVANMELDSDDENNDQKDNKIICLD